MSVKNSAAFHTGLPQIGGDVLAVHPTEVVFQTGFPNGEFFRQQTHRDMLLYYTKIQKFGMLTITGIIGGIFFYLIGYGWIGLLGWVLGGILSDVVLKIGGYQKFKATVLSYACFCLGIMGCPANLWFAGEAYWENIHTSMGDQYANTLQSLMPSWMLYVGFALLFVGGILGALLGHKMLKKHFERAGIV